MLVHETMMTIVESFSLFLVLVGSCTTVVAVVVYLCITAWLRLRRVGEIFQRQGIDGPPPPSFLSGNLSEMQARVAAAAAAEEAGRRDFQKEGFDDYCKRIFPYFDKWRKAYGQSPERLRKLMIKASPSLRAFLFLHPWHPSEQHWY